MSSPTLTPRLICSSSDAAIEFYTEVFGAKLVERYAMPNGNVVHAALEIGDHMITLADEWPDSKNVTPSTLGGSPVILQLFVDDPDATCEKAVAKGAKVLFPIADQFYGHREGRISDPQGHLWIIGKVIKTLAPEEIQKMVDEYPAP